MTNSMLAVICLLIFIYNPPVKTCFGIVRTLDSFNLERAGVILHA